MRILQICNRIPWPVNDGGALASFVMNRSLAQHAEVKLLAIETPENKAQNAKKQGPWTQFDLFTQAINTKPTKTKAAFNLFSKLPFHVSRFYSQEMAKQFESILATFQPQIILFEAPQTTRFLPIAKAKSKAKLILRAHNIEHQIWERLAQTTPNKLLKTYLGVQNNKLKTYELDLLKNLDGVLTLSDADTSWFVTNGFKTDKICQVFPGLMPFPHKPSPANEYAAFLGSLNWLPNLEGVEWLLQQVWPLFHQMAPNYRLSIAGKHMPTSWKNSNQMHIDFLGEVPDAQAFWQNYGICLVPLLAGSGIRVRIIEAMALGKVVISTSVGVQGLPKPLPGVLIADTPTDFAKAWHYLCTNQQERIRMGFEAFEFAQQHFDALDAAKNVVSFFNRLIN